MIPDLLDLRTVTLVVTFVSMTSAATMVLLWRSRLDENSLPLWALGAVLVALGYLGISLRGVVPLFISIPVANACITVGHACFLRGVDSLLERKPLPWTVIGTLGVVTMAVLSYFAYATESTAARMVFQFLAIGLLSLITALRLWRSGNAETRIYYRTVAMIFSIFGTILLLRLCFMPFDPPGQNLFAPNRVHAVVFVAFLLFYAALMYCFPALLFAKDTITRQIAAQKYKNIIETAIDGFWAVDLTGRLIDVNDAYCRMSGYHREELLGLCISDFDASETPEETAAHLQKVLTGGGDRFESRHRRKDGTIYDVEISAQYSKYQGNMIFAFFQDISERKHAEQEIRRANAMLEAKVQERTAELLESKNRADAASQAKSRFLSSISHEIRTPLNAVVGHSQLLEMSDELSANSLDSVHEIKQAGTHLLTLVNQILDLADIESGKLEFRFETVALAEILEESWAQNVDAAKRRNIALVRDRSCEECRVTIDRSRLLQAINNLISNAINYNQPNGSVTVACSALDNDRIRIAVSDTGLGMAADKLSQLFQSFNRLGEEMGRVEGAGIGLVITRQVMEAMNATIGVDSTPGVGSTFWLEMPGQLNAPRNLSPSGAGCASEVPARRPRVLVAEDYAPNQAVLRLQLNSLGCEVDMVADGAMALKRWRNGRYDLILSDVNMPVMNGFELTKAVRQHEAVSGGRTPIIAITAAVVPAELQRCRDADMDDVLSKPIDLDDLRSVIARWSPSSPPADPASPPVQMREPDADMIFDIDQLYRILGRVSIDHAQELVAVFMRSAAEGLKQLAACVDDAAAVAREMHKQKSSARTVGAQRYARHAETLEQQAKAGEAISLEILHGALADFRLASKQLDAGNRLAVDEPPRQLADNAVSCRSVMVIDDDPVVLQQMMVMLAGLGVKEVLAADNGPAALRIIKERGVAIEALVCDLNMPEMDGVQLIRQFRETDFRGGLILMSGADEKVLNTVSELAVRQGLRVLGQAQKPVVPDQMAALLARLTESVVGKRLQRASAEVSAVEIREGMHRDEFSIWFQPKVDATTLRPIGVEALARWRRPDGNFIPPDNFIVAAERHELIGELSQILVSKALLEGARLHDAGFPLKIAVNLSGRWLDDLNLPDFVLATSQMARLKVGDILFEVTETGVMEDLTVALDVLSRLRLKGFGLSIDDFGIGYSSFEQLGRIPFTELKLDRSFVIKGNQDIAARAILESSMDMARKLGLATVAEGVETEADLELVRTLGCNALQGYLLAKPMPVADLLPWLKNDQEKSP